jgi:streptogramin lyase
MSFSIFANLSDVPTGIAFDNLGNLYCSQYNGTISKITPNGVVSTFATGLPNPFEIVFDNLGNLYSANYGDNTISKITSDGVISTFVSTELSNPVSLTFDNSGNLYCGNFSSDRISKITPNGVISTFLNIGYSAGLFGLEFDDSGNLYSSLYSDNTILKISPNGIASDFVSSGLNQPIGLTSDYFGNLYCCDYGNNRIVKITLDGSLSVIFSSLESNPRCPRFDNSGNLYCASANGKIFKFDSVAPPPIVDPISNICFPAGTPINTDQGLIPIEQIDSNICTIRGNKIETITKTITKDKYLLCIEKDALAKNIPSQKTLISKNHTLLYNGKMIKAKELLQLNNEGIYKVKYTGSPLYNVLLQDKHDKMIVNNLICETLDPENGISRMYLDLKNANFALKERENFIKKYNEYVIQNKIFSK